MKIFFSIASLLLTLSSVAQKPEIRHDVIYVHDTRYALIEEYGCGTFSNHCTVTIRNLDESTAITIRYDNTSYGGYTYATLEFPALNKKARVENLSRKPLKVADKLISERLFKKGALDVEAAEKFIAANPA